MRFGRLSAAKKNSLASPIDKPTNVRASARIARIVIKCFDQNRLGARDFEGIVEIDVREMLAGESGIVEKWLPFAAYKGDIDVSG